jgi:2-aminoethylphosphonate dioxygenase
VRSDYNAWWPSFVLTTCSVAHQRAASFSLLPFCVSPIDSGPHSLGPLGTYMLSTPTLTDSQLAEFNDIGFVVIRGAFGTEEMATIDRWCAEILAAPEVSGRHWVYHERADGNDLVSRIENIYPFHDGFAQLIDVLAVPTAQLLGEDAQVFKEKVNFKMPGGDGFTPHQDSQAGWNAYADFFISALVSVDAATVENGCLELCAGQHNRGLFKSWAPLSEADMEGMVFESVPTQPGDVVFFDCFAPHRSEPNRTDTMRRIYYATYNRASAGAHMEQYYADKFANYPPDIDRDPNRDYVFKV